MSVTRQSSCVSVTRQSSCQLHHEGGRHILEASIVDARTCPTLTKRIQQPRMPQDWSFGCGWAERRACVCVPVLIDSGGIFVGYSHGATCRVLRQMPHTEIRSLKRTCRHMSSIMRKTYRRKRQRQLSLAPCLRLHIVPTPCLLLVCTCRHERGRSDPSGAAATVQAREKNGWISRTTRESKMAGCGTAYAAEVPGRRAAQ